MSLAVSWAMAGLAMGVQGLSLHWHLVEHSWNTASWASIVWQTSIGSTCRRSPFWNRWSGSWRASHRSLPCLYGACWR